jgi:hypothetical protein
MPYEHQFQIAEESREAMGRVHPMIVNQVSQRFPCTKYNPKTYVFSVVGLVHQGKDIAYTVTACLQDSGIKSDNPRRFEIGF